MASNGISALLDMSGRALNVQSQAIRVIGNNIANVNTPGYSRRRVEINTVDPQSVGEVALGNGAQLGNVSRFVDQFVNQQLIDRSNDRSSATIKDEFLSRLQGLFPVDGSVPTIGDNLSKFFASLDDLTTNPSDVSLRSNVIEAGRALALSIRTTANELASLQRQADGRIATAVTQVNTITQQIADVNAQIEGSETGGQENLSLRDQRDQLLRELSEKITFDTVVTTEGQVYVTLANGFGLVTGAGAKQLEFNYSPSFSPVGGYAKGLDETSMGFVVYDYDPSVGGSSHINLNDVLVQGGGEIGGLLQFRGTQRTTDTGPFDTRGDVVDVAARIEAIGRDLLTRFNQSYVGPDETTSVANHQSSSFDLNDISPSAYTATPVFGLFNFTGVTDTTGTIGLADTSDMFVSGYNSFSRRIDFAVQTAEAFAAGRDLDLGTGGSLVRAPGDATNITGTTGYNGLAQLRGQTQNYAIGSFSSSSTIEDVYSSTVTMVGGMKARSASNLQATTDQETQAKELQNSVSGVSLDEEFAQLVLFQKAFEASARMVKVGDDLLSEIVQLLG